MKVYILVVNKWNRMQGGYSHQNVGVYLNKDKANEAMAKWNNQMEIWELDDVYSLEEHNLQ